MKQYRITRYTKTHVWVKWDAYGYSAPRGTSRCMPIGDFIQRTGVPPSVYFKQGATVPKVLLFPPSTGRNNAFNRS